MTDSARPKAVFQSAQLNGSEMRTTNADMTFKLPEGDYLDSVIIRDANIICPNVGFSQVPKTIN